MPSIKPVHWKKLLRIFERIGYKKDRQKGSHIVMVRENSSRPIIIPKYDQVGKDIITGLIKTAKIDRKTYFELLDDC